MAFDDLVASLGPSISLLNRGHHMLETVVRQQAIGSSYPATSEGLLLAMRRNVIQLGTLAAQVEAAKSVPEQFDFLQWGRTEKTLQHIWEELARLQMEVDAGPQFEKGLAITKMGIDGIIVGLGHFDRASVTPPTPFDVDSALPEGFQLGASAVPTASATEAVVLASPPTSVESLVLDAAPPAASEERYVVLKVVDEAEDRTLDLDEGLIADRRYRLWIDLSNVADLRQADAPNSLKRDDGETLTFIVAIVPRGGSQLHFRNQVQPLVWGPDGVKAASFLFDTVDAGAATFDVLIHHDFDLLFTATVKAEVVMADEPKLSEIPIRWRDTTSDVAARSKVFRRFQKERGLDRAMCIAVQRGDESDSYLLTVLTGTAELPVRAVFSRPELDANWLELRGILDRLRRDPVMLDGGYDENGEYDGDFSKETYRRRESGSTKIQGTRAKATMDEYLLRLALAGVGFRSKLFPDKARQQVLEVIRARAKAGSIVQIWLAHDAAAFNLPWHWLYDGALDPSWRGDKVDPTLFWGYRLIIEQVGDWLDPGIHSRPSALLGNRRSLRVRCGSWQFNERSAHLATVQKELAASGLVIDWDEWQDDAAWEAFLPKCDAHLLYFFAHGHTAMPASQGADAVRSFVTDAIDKLQAAMADETLSKAARESLASTVASFQELVSSDALWNHHYIRLQRGLLQMDDLRQFALADGVSALVVLNMCESAQVYPSLTDGLAQAFLQRGAVGVLGTEVAMLPAFAALFGCKLAHALAAGTPIGSALLNLRRNFLDKRNPLGFAYTYYGDVSARIVPIPVAA